MKTLKYTHLAPNVWKALEKEVRKGWVQRGVKHPETVALHTLKMLEIGKELAQHSGYTTEERDDLYAMLEIHDWPEAIHGDVITTVGIDHERETNHKAEKFLREKSAMEQICAPLGDTGQTLLTLWLRFEEGIDRVAKDARDIDKYQAIEQAFEYERTQGIVGLGDEFVKYSPEVTHPYLCQRLDTHCGL